MYWFYGKQGPDNLSGRLTNQNPGCEDHDHEVHNADSDESGTDNIYYGNVCVIYI